MKRTACLNGGRGGKRERGKEGREGGRALDPVRPSPPLLFFRGHDFRGDYRTLGQVRSALSSTPFVALTATAPPRVRDDIAASLGLRLGPGDAGRHVLSFERPNLHLAVCKRPPGPPRDHLAALVEQHRALGRLDPTIVYTISRSDAERVRDDLVAAGLGDAVAVYHAGAADKGAVHERFLRDEVAVVVATVAFGMGIDKPNVRGRREGRWREGGERSASASDVPHHCIFSPDPQRLPLWRARHPGRLLPTSRSRGPGRASLAVHAAVGRRRLVQGRVGQRPRVALGRGAGRV